jgi:hypothetical protein
MQQKPPPAEKDKEDEPNGQRLTHAHGTGTTYGHQRQIEFQELSSDSLNLKKLHDSDNKLDSALKHSRRMNAFMVGFP